MMRTTVIASLLVAGLATLSQACSRVLWNTSGRSVLVGRNMDWLNAMAVDLYTLPRGKSYDGLTGPNTWKVADIKVNLVSNCRLGAYPRGAYM